MLISNNVIKLLSNVILLQHPIYQEKDGENSDQSFFLISTKRAGMFAQNVRNQTFSLCVYSENLPIKYIVTYFVVLELSAFAFSSSIESKSKNQSKILF